MWWALSLWCRRGISPIEVGFYGVNFRTGAEQFREAYEASISA